MDGLFIQNTAQPDLTSETKPGCSFDEEISHWIDKNCPGWNHPNVRKTFMIPPTFPDMQPDNKGDLAEKDVFDMLENFGNKTQQPMFVVHSHKFHELLQNLEKGSVKNDDLYWCRGETDFVIIHRTLGVIFLQVKAATKTARKYVEAKDQLDKDLMALTCSLKRLSISDVDKKEGKKIEQNVEREIQKYPGFVVMPNCSKDKAGGRIGCFREDLVSMEQFEKWWDENVQNKRRGDFCQDMYKLMAIWFVGPRVIKEPCLIKDVVDSTHKRLIKLTADQLSIMTQDVPKQDIMGPAGSGKTWLLVAKAKQLAGKLKQNERILIMCFNKPLSLYLEKTFQEFPKSKVVVKTFVSILRKIIGKEIDVGALYDNEKKKLVCDCVQKLMLYRDPTHRYMYEHVFVDEGQDMYGIWMELVNLMHADSDEDRRYRWVFFDNNQSVHFGTEYSIPQRVRNNAKLMNRVVRNTFNIFQCSHKLLSPSVGAELAHGIVGLPVKWIDSLPAHLFHCLEEGVELVVEEIVDLHRESVKMSDIVVLTNDRAESEDVCAVFWYSHSIPTQNAEEAILHPDISAITVDSIRRFKGLESKVVILLDPPLDEEENMDLNYVAMSRCFCLLIIVTTQEKKQMHEEYTMELREGRN
ncbi:uncharacterized protein LOC118422759 [Branchiostoma floridae]|uniref:Uncharacterized protein LOC118422759 n=1 Tax=Branchiostoma floridae TaxID=7739 RepID=A0A9J7LQK6_BRAFL|nr:uncharacterized protein LOC118422759 [Branchiostoma floridae]